MPNSDVVKPVFTTILPAHSGHYVLGVVLGDRGEPAETVQYPVLLWAVEEESLAPYPVTLEGVQYACPYVLQPDGSVERAGIDGYADISQWFAAQVEEWAASNSRVIAAGNAHD